MKTKTLCAIALLGMAEWAAAQTGSTLLRVRCDGDSVGAEVSIDGKFKGECPFDTKVPAGRLKIEARKPVDKEHERFFEQEMRVGVDTVKAIDIVLSAPQLTAEAKRARDIEVEAQRRAQAERDAQAKAEAERRHAELLRPMRTAAAGGDIEAMEALARAYSEGMHGLPVDKAQADAWHAQANAAYRKTAQAISPGQTFKECVGCPEMVAIPAGNYLMGSPPGEGDDDERPQRSVSVPQFALGKHEVTVGQWRRFVAATNYVTDAERNEGGTPGCRTLEDGKWYYRSGHSWRYVGFAQADTHPVVCVSWNDAQTYVQWISRETGQTYRLPSEAEWEYAARAGSQASRPWGDDPNQACAHANVADQTPGPSTWLTKQECSDGYFFTAPVGTFRANAFGLHDMIGNTVEWVQDCFDDKAYAGKAPSDGRAFEETGCSRRVMRGTAWTNGPSSARAAVRFWASPGHRGHLQGLRLARMLP